MTFLNIVLWVLFFLSAALLVVIVLLQESKGGGLAEAFGGIGAETFGVKTGGINKFTFAVAGVFVVAAILIQALTNAGA
ncbi:MAG: preprotein translocase subunit SecG [Planctomycetes bacterium]|nr:preprotein translocase subunit SecG [Planctomycetota bacterium]